MDRTPIENSSNLVSYAYDESSQTLEIDFKGGGTYAYSGVDPDTAAGFRDAVEDKEKSAGSYLNSQIKGKFDYTKLS